MLKMVSCRSICREHILVIFPQSIATKLEGKQNYREKKKKIEKERKKEATPPLSQIKENDALHPIKLPSPLSSLFLNSKAPTKKNL
jgi:hypothetical protein